MKRIILLFAILCSYSATYALNGGSLTVTSVVSTPVTGITEINYDLNEPGKGFGIYDITVAVSFDNGSNYTDISTIYLSGDVANVAPGAGKQIIWNGGASHPNTYSEQTKIRLTANEFICGTSTVAFMYNGSQVVYGTVVGNDGRCWLDRNLGASQEATKINGTDYGDLFQWGRAADGHQLRESTTTTTLSSTDTPGHDKFILSQDNFPYDWRNSKNDNLWQGVNGVNNPCPTGWRVPTKEEWEIEIGLTKVGSMLNLPSAGYRSEINGNISYSGGYYWSSTVVDDPNNAWRMQTGSGMQPSRRADGFSVRCIKDQPR